MNQVIPFMYGAAEVKTININNEPWFLAKDICDVVDIKNTAQALDGLDEDEKLVYAVHISGQSRESWFVNEPGLYTLIIRSRKPEAKQFKRWITHEVIPSIRKHGAYMTESTIERMVNDPDFLIKLGETLKAEQEARRALEQKIQIDQPKVLFADSLQASSDCILIANLAKILKQNGVNTGQNRLYQWMRENGYLGKRGEHWNMPTQRAMDLKLFEVKTTVMNRPDKDPRTTKTTVVTGRGQMYFLDKLKTGA
ncbi:phage antirepressor Ant [Paenibacillus amylolyticus]|uniref:phage antirepressor KilAC domain-containing protein n=1 Tax=Paenibacillus amylolyticus TaxID=1451 RepID=UPI00096F6B1B|nr:phage antirepressor [Paenibacillus amylolyticus]OMF00256.1 phage antirepressor Ant [Paenibacillus amylolyticus]